MPAVQEQAPGDLGVARLLAAAAAAGLAAQTVQAICLREVLEVARGGEAVLGLALAAWLLGGALGALTWRGSPFSAAVLSLLLPLLLVRLLRTIAVSPGGSAPLASLVALPMAYGPGAFFGSVLRRAPARRAVAIEALGAGVAGTLLTFVLLDALPAMHLVSAAGVLAVVSAARGRAILLLVLLVPVAYVAAGRDGLLLERRARGIWPGSDPVRIEESRYGRLLWLRRGEQHALFVGGQLALTAPDDVEAEAFVNVVLAAHPHPRRVLVLGPGLSGILRECFRHPVETLEVVLADERILSIVLEDLPEADRYALARAQVRIGDIRKIAAEEPRDVVLSLSPPPLTLSSNRVFTREFFASLRLAEGGFVAFALPAAANEREGEILARNVSVFRALEPLKATVLPGAHDLFLAGALAPDVDPAVLSARLDERGIVLRHHAQDFFAEDFAPEEVARVTAAYRDYPARPPPAVPFEVAAREPAGPAPDPLPNEDLHPGAVLLSAAALAREATAPLLGAATHLAPFSPALLLALAAAGAVVARRRGPVASAALSAATSGAASMGLWTTVLMAYQARVGALYGDLALLAAAFMGGLALGAAVRTRLLVIDAAFVAAALLVWAALPEAGRWTAVGLAIGVGALGGATLAVAASASPARASRLYAWDLLGAALAALVFGTFLVPALGAAGACLTAAGVKLLSLAGAPLPRAPSPPA